MDYPGLSEKSAVNACLSLNNFEPSFGIDSGKLEKIGSDSDGWKFMMTAKLIDTALTAICMMDQKYITGV